MIGYWLNIWDLNKTNLLLKWISDTTILKHITQAKQKPNKYRSKATRIPAVPTAVSGMELFDLFFNHRHVFLLRLSKNVSQF